MDIERWDMCEEGFEIVDCFDSEQKAREALEWYENNSHLGEMSISSHELK